MRKKTKGRRFSMPTYEYQCLDCGVRFDRFQSIVAAPIEECPECNGNVKRLIGAGAGLIFKGSGFYITDYRSNSYTEAAKKDKGVPSNEGGKSRESCPTGTTFSGDSKNSSKTDSNGSGKSSD
jgi:putative FmdB family regulatory protein